MLDACFLMAIQPEPHTLALISTWPTCNSSQLKCPVNHPLQFSAINLMTQADWKEYKKLVPGMSALYGGLMPLQN